MHGRSDVEIDDLELVDYKVRILNGGTEAITRVLIESRDGEGDRWMTVGVSSNIIDASFEALLDSVNYKLLRASADARVELDDEILLHLDRDVGALRGPLEGGGELLAVVVEVVRQLQRRILQRLGHHRVLARAFAQRDTSPTRHR